jgi:lipoprotein-releasing system permease protein
VFNAFERAVAARYLRARSGERFVSVIAAFSLIGIALGVATLIIVMSVMGGFKVDLLNRILGFNGDLGVYGPGGVITGYGPVAARIARLPGVTAAIPVVDGQVLLTNPNGTSAGGFVRGIAPADLARLRAVATHIEAGSLAAFHGNDAIAIGVGMARQFGVGIGGRITLVSPQGAATPFGTIPRVRAYRVVAIFNVGENDYDSSYVFMPLKAAQIYFQKPGAVTQIAVTVRHPERVRQTTDAIRRAFPPGALTVIDWQSSNNGFFTAVAVEQNVMFLILTLIILVAAFNVISSLIMMVKDKTRDIAVLRTLGAGRGAIMRIFLMCGASVGLVGTAAGAVLGIAFTLNLDRIQDFVTRVTGVDVCGAEVYYLPPLAERLDWAEVTRVIVMALALSLLATLYPSWRAARTDPVEALRSE